MSGIFSTNVLYGNRKAGAGHTSLAKVAHSSGFRNVAKNVQIKSDLTVWAQKDLFFLLDQFLTLR